MNADTRVQGRNDFSGNSPLEQTVVSQTATPRISVIDSVKGICVIAMVIYHTFNYSAWKTVPGQYMAFVPPSFILITGFLITNIYTARYSSSDRKLYRRLILRGLKLLSIFTVLNLGAFMLSDNQGFAKTGLLEEVRSIYIFGGRPGTAFEILLPISYLLVASPLFLEFHFVSRMILPLIAAILFVACTVMEASGFTWNIANMFVVGLVGMAAGQTSLRTWEAAGKNLVIACAIYAMYWILRGLFGQIYPMQVFVTCATVFLLFALGIRVFTTGKAVQEVNRLGRYSLIAYIAQIAVLQILDRTAMLDAASPVSVSLMGLCTLLSTWVVIFAIEAARRRIKWTDQIYRALFG
jgi:hypothetical protein